MDRLAQLLVAAALLTGTGLTTAGSAPARPGAAGHESASSTVSTVASFDPSAGEFPESLALDKRGNVYVSFPFLGEVWKLAPDGSRSIFATLAPAGSLCCYDLENLSVAGLAVDASGDVYAAVIQLNPAVHGVWRVARDGGRQTRLPGSEQIRLPNALAFDPRGNLYVTDSILGAVWRIAPGGSAELWVQDELLEGNGSFGLGFPIGANGIVYRHDSLYVANTERGSLVRIPVDKDGSAGEPELLMETPDLIGADGIALDVHGSIYVGVNGADVILRFEADGSARTTIATPADGLQTPSSLAFGTGHGDRRSLFITNYLAEAPGILKLPVGVPGLPLP
jgi:sugar lactone lactonase YvrE